MSDVIGVLVCLQSNAVPVIPVSAGRSSGLHVKKKKLRIGVELDGPLGKNNGSIDGHAYFSCPADYGILVLPSRVRLDATRANSDATGESGGQHGEPAAEPTAEPAADPAPAYSPEAGRKMCSRTKCGHTVVPDGDRLCAGHLCGVAGCGE